MTNGPLKLIFCCILDNGYSHEEVSTILRLDNSTVRRHEKAYQIQGLTQYLKNPFSGGTYKLEANQIEALERYLDEHLCESTDEAIAYVNDNWGVSYTRAGMAALQA